jgi:phage replication O-like protein O
MTDTPSKIIPNSFQTPNFFVDECMALLTGNEYKCLSFLARKTFGWQKRSDRIAKSQIMAATGLANETVDKAMNTLVGFGLVLRVSENNPQNTGTEWALQTDDSKVRFDLLLERQEKAVEAQRQKTEKGRQKLAEKRGGKSPKGGLLDNPPSDEVSVGQTPAEGEIVEQLGGGIVRQLGGGSVGQSPQKPIKAKENMGANAPASPAEKTIQEPAPEVPDDPLETRIAAFPAEYQPIVRLMLDLFGVRPPEKPEPNQKGGDYALWLKGIRDLLKLVHEYDVPLEKAMRLTFERWRDRTFDVSHPGALKKTMTSLLAQVSRQKLSAPKPEMPRETTPPEPGAVPNDELLARMEALRKRRKTQNQE